MKYSDIYKYKNGGYASEAEYKAHLLDPYSEKKRANQLDWLKRKADMSKGTLPKNETSISSPDNTKVFQHPLKTWEAIQKAKGEYNYYNPPVEEGITTGDWKQDVLYKNQWLFDTPIVGDYIKGKAKEIMKQSPLSYRTEEDLVDNGIENKEKNNQTSYTYTGSDNRGSSIDLVEQYMEGNKLDKSKYKPKSDYLEFLPSYSVKKDFNLYPKEYKNKILNEYLKLSAFKKENLDEDDASFNKERTLDKEKYNEFLQTKKPIFKKHNETSILSKSLGLNLGGHKTGVGFDEEVNLPYVSMSDAWDFEPKHYSSKWNEPNKEQNIKIQSSLLHKAGKPFKVYDRFYFNPETQEYVDDSEIEKLKTNKDLIKRKNGGIVNYLKDNYYNKLK
jgi:hypothetical protein